MQLLKYWSFKIRPQSYWRCAQDLEMEINETIYNLKDQNKFNDGEFFFWDKPRSWRPSTFNFAALKCKWEEKPIEKI